MNESNLVEVSVKRRLLTNEKRLMSSWSLKVENVAFNWLIGRRKRAENGDTMKSNSNKKGGPKIEFNLNFNANEGKERKGRPAREKRREGKRRERERKREQLKIHRHAEKMVRESTPTK